LQIISAELCRILRVKQGSRCWRCYVTYAPIFWHSIGCWCDRHATRDIPSAGEKKRRWPSTEFCDLWPTHFISRQSYRISGNDVTPSRSSQRSTLRIELTPPINRISLD